jgi:hypothetical protein
MAPQSDCICALGIRGSVAAATQSGMSNFETFREQRSIPKWLSASFMRGNLTAFNRQVRNLSILQTRSSLQRANRIDARGAPDRKKTGEQRDSE